MGTVTAFCFIRWLLCGEVSLRHLRGTVISMNVQDGVVWHLYAANLLIGPFFPSIWYSTYTLWGTGTEYS